MSKNLMNYTLSEPLSGAASARVTIHAGYGNLTIDGLQASQPLLASGTLQYLEKQDAPICARTSSDSFTELNLQASKGSKPWFQFPWSACRGATAWLVHLNSGVSYDLRAGCNGGNIRLDLDNMRLTSLQVENGGGNLDVVLPDQVNSLEASLRTGAGNLSVEIGSRYLGSSLLSAGSGAGNVSVRISAGMPARITATSSLGKVLIDPTFLPAGPDTYQSPDYDQAANRINISAKSGAGNVSILIK